MVYLFHFVGEDGETTERLHHAGHYLGYTPDETPVPEQNRRMAEHLRGGGARLTQVWVGEHGKKIVLARTWPGGDRQLERKLKNRKNAPKLCPICEAERKRKLAEATRN